MPGLILFFKEASSFLNRLFFLYSPIQRKGEGQKSENRLRLKSTDYILSLLYLNAYYPILVLLCRQNLIGGKAVSVV